MATTYTLRCEMKVPLGLKETFAVFEDPRNLARITPPWLNFRIVSPRVEMRPGAEIDYEIRWFGLPMKWKTIIAAYEPPFVFVDVQERGPYSFWRHTHSFREVPGGTAVADRVDYRLPLGPLGSIAHAVMVGAQLKAIFRYRQTALARLMGGGEETLAPRISTAEAEERLAHDGAH